MQRSKCNCKCNVCVFTVQSLQEQYICLRKYYQYDNCLHNTCNKRECYCTTTKLLKWYHNFCLKSMFLPEHIIKTAMMCFVVRMKRGASLCTVYLTGVKIPLFWLFYYYDVLYVSVCVLCCIYDADSLMTVDDEK